MTLSEALGFVAAGLVLLTFAMRTMAPMRLAAIGSNVAFIAYALSLELTPVWLLHGLLLPLNLYRLLEWRWRAHPLGSAPAGGRSPEQRVALIAQRRLARGDVLFRKGDLARESFYILKGRVRLRDIDGTIGAGDAPGELGLASPGRRRTATAVCETDCLLLVVSEPQRGRRPEPLGALRRAGLGSLMAWAGRARGGARGLRRPRATAPRRPLPVKGLVSRLLSPVLDASAPGSAAAGGRHLARVPRPPR